MSSTLRIRAVFDSSIPVRGGCRSVLVGVGDELQAVADLQHLLARRYIAKTFAYTHPVKLFIGGFALSPADPISILRDDDVVEVTATTSISIPESSPTVLVNGSTSLKSKKRKSCSESTDKIAVHAKPMNTLLNIPDTLNQTRSKSSKRPKPATMPDETPRNQSEISHSVTAEASKSPKEHIRDASKRGKRTMDETPKRLRSAAVSTSKQTKVATEPDKQTGKQQPNLPKPKGALDDTSQRENQSLSTNTTPASSKKQKAKSPSNTAGLAKGVTSTGPAKTLPNEKSQKTARAFTDPDGTGKTRKSAPPEAAQRSYQHQLFQPSATDVATPDTQPRPLAAPSNALPVQSPPLPIAPPPPRGPPPKPNANSNPNPKAAPPTHTPPPRPNVHPFLNPCTWIGGGLPPPGRAFVPLPSQISSPIPAHCVQPRPSRYTQIPTRNHNTQITLTPATSLRARTETHASVDEVNDESILTMGQEDDALPAKPKRPYEVVSLLSLNDEGADATLEKDIRNLILLSRSSLPVKDDIIFFRTLTLDLENRVPVQGPWQLARVVDANDEEVHVSVMVDGEGEREIQCLSWEGLFQVRLKQRRSCGGSASAGDAGEGEGGGVDASFSLQDAIARRRRELTT